MNIIFLDIDGVLNNTYSNTMYNTKLQNDNYDLDERNLDNLNYVLDKTNAKVVLLTSWRKYPDNYVWKYKGFNYKSLLPRVREFLGDRLMSDELSVCPHIKGNTKGDDIKLWFDSYGNMENNFAIIDDAKNQHLSDFGDHYFMCDPRYGLDHRTRTDIVSYLCGTKKVIFLDIDGVLNCTKDKSTYLVPGRTPLSKLLVKRFNKIMDKTDAYIVFSTSWRCLGDRVKELNKNQNIGDPYEIIKSRYSDRVLGDTPKKMSSTRCEEISMYVTEHNTEIKDYVILDDAYNGLLDKHVFLTDPINGLTNSIVKNVINYLNKN